MSVMFELLVPFDAWCKVVFGLDAPLHMHLYAVRRETFVKKEPEDYDTDIEPERVACNDGDVTDTETAAEEKKIAVKRRRLM